jgi:hypothetical protein
MKKILAMLFTMIILISAMSISFADNPNRENGEYLGNNKAIIGETLYDCLLLEEKLLSGKNKLEPGTDISTVPNNQQIKQKQLDYFLENWSESLLENETALEEFQNEIASKEMNTGKNVKIDGQTFNSTNKTTNTWTEEGLGNVTVNGTTKEVNGNWTYTETIWYKFIFELAGTSGQGPGTSGAPATGQDILLYSYEKIVELTKLFIPFETEEEEVDDGNKTIIDENTTKDNNNTNENKTNFDENTTNDDNNTNENKTNFDENTTKDNRIYVPENTINENNTADNRNYFPKNAINENNTNESIIAKGNTIDKGLAMKKTGLPLSLLLVVLLSLVGFAFYRKQ